MKLSEVPVGAQVTVCSVALGAEGQGRRLEDMGVIAGTVIRVERRAPLGDPTIYEVRQARLAVRRADAALVDVEPVEAVLETAGTLETGTDSVAGGDDVAL